MSGKLLSLTTPTARRVLNLTAPALAVGMILVSQAQALIPNELLDRINKFAFSNAPAGSVPAPPCRKQGPYTYGGETTQYPHVKAGTGR